MALWSLEPLPANITPGFNWRGKDFSFSSSGPFCYYWSQVLAWDQIGVRGLGTGSGKCPGGGGEKKASQSLGAAAPPGWGVADLQPDQPGEGWSLWP